MEEEKIINEKKDHKETISLSLLNDNYVPFRSVNLHITKACNYRCRFCFAHFYGENDELKKEKWIRIIEELEKHGVEKITFVGGEPTLVSYLTDLIKKSKDLGITTMMVTNGSRLTDEYLDDIQDHIDWIGLSIDSGIEEVCMNLGRGEGNHVAQTVELAEKIYERGINLKINSVITTLTYQEDMVWLLEKLKPDRWKVFQMLPVIGENDQASDLLLNRFQFKEFIENHQKQHPIWESNKLMRGAYLMVDPIGRLFDNVTGRLRYSSPILDVGLENALSEIEFDYLKFRERGGEYEW